MELINKVLNIVAPPLVILLLLLYVPLFQLPKLMFSVLRSFFFAEDVTGKVVIITGAASGIGKELAYEYARRRACLVLADIREENLGKVADTCLEIGSPDVVTLTADVSDVNHCDRIVKSTISHFGRLDHLVNNAGIVAVSRVEDYEDISATRPIMDVNFWGYVYMTNLAIPHLKNTHGKIIVMASVASWTPMPWLTIYNASKAALIAFYNTLRVEVGSDIHITMVTPGFIVSEMTKGKHLGKDGQMTVDETLELAYEYARRRACLVLADIREENLGKVADTCLEIGSPDVVTLTADVSNVNHCSRVVNSAISHFGRLDHLVNNAGIGVINLVEDYDDISNTRQVMDVNFWGFVYMTRSAIPHLRNTHGKIIVMASTASWIPAPRLSIYNASKTALVAFYNTLRVEVGSDIHITVVTPGLTESEMTEGKHLGKNGQMTIDEKAVPKHIIPLGKAESCAKLANGDRFRRNGEALKVLLRPKPFPSRDRDRTAHSLQAVRAPRIKARLSTSKSSVQNSSLEAIEDRCSRLLKGVKGHLVVEPMICMITGCTMCVYFKFSSWIVWSLV